MTNYWVDPVLFPLSTGFVQADRLPEALKKDRKEFSPTLDLEGLEARRPAALSDLRAQLVRFTPGIAVVGALSDIVICPGDYQSPTGELYHPVSPRHYCPLPCGRHSVQPSRRRVSLGDRQLGSRPPTFRRTSRDSKSYGVVPSGPICFRGRRRGFLQPSFQAAPHIWRRRPSCGTLNTPSLLFSDDLIRRSIRSLNSSELGGRRRACRSHSHGYGQSPSSGPSCRTQC